MQEQFAEGIDDAASLTMAERRTLNKKNGRRSASRLFAQLTLLVASAALLIGVRDTAWVWPALLLHGVFHFQFFGLLHESCHGTLFESSAFNAAAGWVAAMSHPMSPALMRAFHFAHHRHTHDLEHDPELAGLAFMQRWPRHIMWLVTISGLPIIIARTGWAFFAAMTPRVGPFQRAWSATLPFVTPDARRRIAWEARLLVVVHASVISAAWVFWPPLLWTYAGLAVGHALLSVYITCEHRGLPDTGNIFNRTRSINTHPFVRWLLWNMPYHAEHHAWPSVPWHQLPQLHARAQPAPVHHTRGVIQLHWYRGRDPILPDARPATERALAEPPKAV